MSDFYDNMEACIMELQHGYYGNDEAVIERRIEKLFDRLDKAYIHNKITQEEYDELSLELGLVF